MAFPVRCCALVGRFADPRIAESVSALLPHLASRGVQVLVSENAALAAGAAAVTRVPERQFGERADLVIAIGGDGIIVASATGSTAYALSCGGPIIEPHLEALVIAPICAHTLSDRPIVVSSRSLIEVSLLERPDTQAQVTCDGAVLGALKPGGRLEVRTALERITLLHPPGHDYYKLLRSKLHWGRGSFER